MTLSLPNLLYDLCPLAMGGAGRLNFEGKGKNEVNIVNRAQNSKNISVPILALPLLAVMSLQQSLTSPIASIFSSVRMGMLKLTEKVTELKGSLHTKSKTVSHAENAI